MNHDHNNAEQPVNTPSSDVSPTGTNSVEASPAPASRLLQVLGVGFGIAVTVGATVSGGILRSPAEVAAHLPTTWMFVGIWVLGAVYALICSVSFAELSTMIPHSGGFYVFARRALGQYAGFVVGWADWLTSCGTVSASALLISDVLTGLLPELKGKGLLLSSILVLMFGVFQWMGIRLSSIVQSSTSFLKSTALLVVAIAAFVLGGHVTDNVMLFNAAPQAAAATGISLFMATILAFQVVIYMYDGYYGVVYFGEEVVNPGRDIPRSMFTSVLISGAIYLLLNIAFVYVMPLQGIASSDFIGGAVAKLTFGRYGDAIVRVLIVVCELSTMNAFLMFAVRTLFAMSRDGILTERAAAVNKGGTPTITLGLSILVALAFLLSGTFERALAILTFAIVVNYAICFLSVIVLRFREPETPRPYKAFAYPLTTGISLAVSVMFLIGSTIGDTERSLYALGALALSYPVYLLQKKFWRSVPKHGV
ncbi:MAG: APC family permease [Candidatus Kapaibacterium sp.]|nr:MAG: APC family permease [Candidatus Kapabacteria bacterium]